MFYCNTLASLTNTEYKMWANDKEMPNRCWNIVGPLMKICVVPGKINVWAFPVPDRDPYRYVNPCQVHIGDTPASGRGFCFREQ